MTCEPVYLCDETDPIATPSQRQAYFEASTDLPWLTKALGVAALAIVGAALIARFVLRTGVLA